jgi:DNA-binding beta-propeller fold protein YncE
MSLQVIGTIEIPDSRGGSFDHGAFDPKTRRVFVAHTGRDRVEVVDHDGQRHIATLRGFPEAAGVVADDGHVLVTNRGSAGLAWLDAQSLETRAVFDVAPRPNGVAIVANRGLAIVASIGDKSHGPALQVLGLDNGQRHSVELPGRPRWCVTDAAAKRVFLAIQDPSMILVARLPDLGAIEHWRLPVDGAHGLDIDHQRDRLYVACDDAALVEVEIATGRAGKQWPLAGAPDVTFFNPTAGLVHVAIGEPGVVQSIDPRTGDSTQTMTGAGAHTTALAPPDRLYVFSPAHGAAVALVDS